MGGTRRRGAADLEQGEYNQWPNTSKMRSTYLAALSSCSRRFHQAVMAQTAAPAPLKPTASPSPAPSSASRWCPFGRHGDHRGQDVEVKPFLIGRTEVTWDMYDVFSLGLDAPRVAKARMPWRVRRSHTVRLTTAGATRAIRRSAWPDRPPRRLPSGSRRRLARVPPADRSRMDAGRRARAARSPDTGERRSRLA